MAIRQCQLDDVIIPIIYSAVYIRVKDFYCLQH